MGIATNMLIIMAVINIGLLFFGFDSGATTLFKFLSVDTVTGQISTGTELYSQFLIILGISSGVALTTATAFYLLGAGQYSIFAGIVGWLLGFAFLPTGVLMVTDLPVMVKTILIAPLFMMYILAMLMFFRGYEL